MKISKQPCCMEIHIYANTHIIESYIFTTPLNILVGRLLKCIPFHGTLLWWEVIDIRKEE